MLMVKKILLLLIAILFTFYGVVGFWINIGNQALNPIIFATIMIALILAPITIIFSLYYYTKNIKIKTVAVSSELSLIFSLIDFAVFYFWLSKSDTIFEIKVCNLISGVLIALGLFLLLSSLVLFIIASIKNKKQKSNR